MIKLEDWSTRDRSSIPNVGSLQNANVHQHVFEFDARSLNHDKINQYVNELFLNIWIILVSIIYVSLNTYLFMENLLF